MTMSLLALTLVLIIVVGGGGGVSGTRDAAATAASLRFSASTRSFKILQLADLHFGEAPDTDWGPQQDLNSTRVLRNLLAAETPDLVLLTGDQFTGENIVGRNVSKYFDQLVAPLVESRTPWASIFGNHDNGGVTFSPQDLIDIENRHSPLSFTRAGPSHIHGVTNYYLKVHDAHHHHDDDDDDDDAALLLWMFDTGGNSSDGSVPERIYKDQVDWFTSEAATFPAGTPSLAFLHIPVPTARTLNADFPAECLGLHDETDIATQDSDEGIAESFRALSAAGSLIATFSGHDHGTGWCCPEAGMHVCFGRHSGYGGYGNWARGGRVIEVTLAGSHHPRHQSPRRRNNGRSHHHGQFHGRSVSVRTWIRMEDGQTYGEQVLSDGVALDYLEVQDV